MLVRARCPLVVLLLAASVGCEKPAKNDFSFYDERIAPVLDIGCQRQTTGCHVDDGNGFALGNLDLTSFESLMKRHDVLEAYGPYSVGLLLLKAGDPIRVQVETVDPPDPSQPERRYVTVTTDIRHGGGEGAVAEGSEDYAILKQWIEAGHTRSGVPAGEPGESSGPCASGPGALEGVDLNADPADESSYDGFVSDVQPILRERCAGSYCHGAKTADLYLSCGDDRAELRWNYEVVLRHLSEQAVASEVLRKPLAMRAGGVFHEGGDIFEDTEDPDYEVVLEWIEDVVERRPELVRFSPQDAGLRFFANRVQPVLVRKGCMFLGCHSPAMFHDLRLRGGSRGDFSEVATRRNYEMSRLMLALESPDPNASRLIAKNLCPPESGGHGVKHRGGALFEDFGGCAEVDTRASAALCEGVDVDQGNLDEVPAYCVLAGWQALERELAVERGELEATPGPRGVVWVSRPRPLAGPTGFDGHAPSADLVWADASTGASGELVLGTPRSLLQACGLGTDPDVRGPAVSWDGTRIAFAGRSSADAPLRIYEMAADGSGCAPIAGLASEMAMQNGILLHDFDPAYAPDGRLVFASTRGNLDGAGDYRGPTRTPAALEPNANLYVFDATADPPVRQLTYLLDQELQPSFMADGRVIFTAQKRAEDFHQLAGRRINLDGGDYHPLFAQRPSIGFESATEIVEIANRDLVMVAAPLSASAGGGGIVVVNRSIGPDQDDRDPRDRAYVHSLTTPADSALDGGAGVFRSPAPLPSGRVLVSCDLEASDLSAEPSFGLCELDPSGNAAPRILLAATDRSLVEAVAVYARPAVEVFRSRADELNGSSSVDPDGGDAIVHYLDVPLLGTLLFSNTREGRPIDSRVQGVRLFEVQPPPASATSFDGLGGDVISDDFGRFYQSLRSLGSAQLRGDGSVRLRVPSGMPLSLALTDGSGEVLDATDGAPIPGPLLQREAMQFYPGERLKQSMPRRIFDGVCAGCHGSISGRELDVGVSIDVLTSASKTAARDDLVELR